MKSAAFFALFTALLIGAQATAPIKPLAKTAVVPNRFIIEVDDPSALGRKRSFEHVSPTFSNRTFFVLNSCSNVASRCCIPRVEGACRRCCGHKGIQGRWDLQWCRPRCQRMWSFHSQADLFFTLLSRMPRLETLDLSEK